MKNIFPQRSLASNFLILLAGVAFLLWAARLAQLKLTSIPSIDAVINGAIININAPREGKVMEVTIAVGETTRKGQRLLMLENEQSSQLQVQEITSRLSERKAELAAAQAHLDRLLALQQLATTDYQEQYRLENLEGQRSLNQLESELRGAESRLRLAGISRDRARQLHLDGAVSMADLDSAEAEFEQRQSEVDSIQQQLEILQANLQAAEQGLTLNQTRSNYDPRIRLQEVQMQVADQQEVVERLAQAVEDINAEVEQARLDAARRRTIPIDATNDGVVWSFDIQPGTYVQQGDALGQLLDCSRRWIDTVVDERMLRSLEIGTPATIELYGYNSRQLEGKVSVIRPGIGRLAVGQDVMNPIAANTPRTAQVRVDITEGVDDEGRSRLCYVGHTAKVQFDIR
ncbi:MAG: efflux RND transporter periplasmic adaptor subunit [Cyanobacteria bacterium]|nr:efflux RND transporter periplasmic adaptor subunit [Cyanobacteriota bacterium]